MRRVRRIVTIAALAWIAAAAPTFASCEPERAKEKFPRLSASGVRIASTTTSPPFAYADPSDLDRLTGLEVEMMEAAMRCAGLRYEFIRGPFATLIQTIMSGSADVMIGNVNYRAERAEKVDFVVYLRSGQSVIVRKGNPKGLRALGDLCGNAASSTVGGVSAAEVERQSAACAAREKQAITYVPSVDQEAAVRQLVNGRIDFVMDGSVTARQRAARENDALEIGFTILTDLVVGTAVRKDNPEARQAVLEGIKVIESDGRLTELLTRYGLAELALPVELRR